MNWKIYLSFTMCMQSRSAACHFVLFDSYCSNSQAIASSMPSSETGKDADIILLDNCYVLDEYENCDIPFWSEVI